MSHTPRSTSAEDALLRMPDPFGMQEEAETKREHVPLPDVVTWQARYVIGAKLGEGRTGVVHEAEDLLLGRTVALKELRAASGHSTAVLLAREARALASVSHPAIVHVHSVYPDASPPFLAMERVRGRSLAAVLANGPLPIARTLRILRQVAAGLDALHAAEILHGDVKPGNVVVDADDGAKLVDVGLATFLERVQPGTLFGARTHAAPERPSTEDVPFALATRADVYSFGVLCFEMLAGSLPFLESSTVDMRVAHAMLAAPRLSEAWELSPELDAPIARALAKRPEDRPSTCSEVVDALQSASRGADGSGRRLRVLVADDDPDQRALVRSVFDTYFPGASLVVCATGQAVLEAMMPPLPSVALLDLGMPPPSGIELVRQLRGLAPEVAIVIVTGAGSGREREAARDLGVRRFLVKPFEVDEVILAVRESVDREAPSLLRAVRRGAIRL